MTASDDSSVFAFFVPGLVQLRRGRRLAGVMIGLAAVGLVAWIYAADRYWLQLHGEVRAHAPRTIARELWAEKMHHRHRGVAMLGVLVLLGAVDAALGKPRQGTVLPSD